VFDTKDVIVCIETMKIGAEDTAKGESIRMVELRMAVPVLPHFLADDIDPGMAEGLFMEVGGEWAPLPKCESATWRLAIPIQVMTIKAAADASGEHRFATVDVRKVQTKTHKDTGAHALIFVVAFEQPSARELAWLAQMVTTLVAVSFEPETPSLVDGAGDAS